MTTNESLKGAVQRVQAFLDSREGALGIDLESITSFNGNELRASDLRALVGAVQTNPRPIRPGDLVEHISKPHLDWREVVSVGRDFLTLDFLGSESSRLPLDNYRTQVPCDGSI